MRGFSTTASSPHPLTKASRTPLPPTTTPAPSPLPRPHHPPAPHPAVATVDGHLAHPVVLEEVREHVVADVLWLHALRLHALLDHLREWQRGQGVSAISSPKSPGSSTCLQNYPRLDRARGAGYMNTAIGTSTRPSMTRDKSARRVHPHRVPSLYDWRLALRTIFFISSSGFWNSLSRIIMTSRV